MTLGLMANRGFAQSVYTPYTFATLAGNAGYGSADGAGSTAQFWYPSGVAVDSTGNVYVGDYNNHTIRKVSAAGEVTTLAGLAGYTGSADGIGSDARFNQPFGVTIDSAGNLLVAEEGNDIIRKVTSAGAVTTLAGLAGSPGSLDGTGSTARFDGPVGVTIDSADNLYVADRYNHTIRKITSTGVVTTLAGKAGIFGNVDGTGSEARFNDPYGVAVDSTGNVYVADTGNNLLRKITPTGVVTTVAEQAGVGVAVDTADTIYVADTYKHVIRRLMPAGVLAPLAGLTGSSGSTDGTGSDARFYYPYDLAVDRTGVLYVADAYNHTIRRITPEGTVTTIAGTASSIGNADGVGANARFNLPSGVTVDIATNIYVADTANHTIRRITPAGVVTTLAGLAGYPGSTDGTGTDARFNQSWGVAVDNAGNVYVGDTGNHTIRKVTAAGVVTTLAGLAGSVGGDNGTGSDARFNHPSGVAVDDAGTIYVADTYNHMIRKVTSSGVVTTLAAGFFYPRGVALDSAGNVYVADTGNNEIEKVTPTGSVTALAGGAPGFGNTDGTGNAARFWQPLGLAVDNSGNVYVADGNNNTIRKVTPPGVVTKLAGLPRFDISGNPVGGNADETGNAARFNSPAGVAVDSAGNVYVADAYNNTIRRGYPENVPPIIVNHGPGFGFNVGHFGFLLKGPPGQLVVVEASVDLKSWQPLWTNTFAGTLTFSDPQSSVTPGPLRRRFYRALTP